ncbi:hypothetical protein L3V82_08620 [Thiotrichales bacterium 19S3-7]|nr:hypothetical protein [Thiotrichales bacterium 19S3-7]MCF6802218.1 hypothetical protein [Thiotrichales bacterium 19S3-11]
MSIDNRKHQPIKNRHTQLIESLNENFFNNPLNFTELMHRYCHEIDHFVTSKLIHQIPSTAKNNIALVALGGYSRCELYPFSDLDLMVICSDSQAKTTLADSFVYLWQLPIKINISYRTLNEIKYDIFQDVAFFTSLLNCRLLFGNKQLYDTLKCFLTEQPIKPKTLLEHLYNEELANDKITQQNLEPNLKTAPGNLRTLHKINWLISYYNLNQKLLNTKELEQLRLASAILGKLRFGLHLISYKNENTLYFNHQLSLSRAFNYQSIKQMMQPYYQAVLDIAFLFKKITTQLHDINSDAPLSAHRIKPSVNCDPDVALLKILHNNAQANSKTLPLIAYQLVTNLKDQVIHRQHVTTIGNLFLSLFQYPNTLVEHLIFLHQSKRLAYYLPLFEHTIGLGQFDLFHCFSVDVHSIKVVTEASNLILGNYQTITPDADAIVQKIKPEVLLISAFFHDLGKGLGGNHETIIAKKLCQYVTKLNDVHFLTERDKQLILFLVESHLLMSHTAQKKDISDLGVLSAFANVVKDQITLDYLYLLTICDIRGTNIKLWNHWRFSVLTSLYHKTTHYLKQPNEDIANIQHEDSNKKKVAIGKTNRLKNKYPQSALNHFLNLWGERYLIHFSPSSIQWHLDCILPHLETDGFYLFGRFNPRTKQAEIITYSKNKRFIFGPIAASASRLSLSILDARIYTATSGETFSQYVINHQTDPISLTNEFTLSKIIQQFKTILSSPQKKGTSTKFRKRLPKRYILTSNPKINIQIINSLQLIVEIHTIDYPGILAEIVRVFDQFNLYITHAKINTLDQKIEDIFYLDAQEKQMDQVSIETLESAIIKAIRL